MYYLALQLISLTVVVALGAFFIQLFARLSIKIKPRYSTALKTAFYIAFVQAVISIVTSFVVLDWSSAIPRILIIFTSVASFGLCLYIGALLVKRYIVNPAIGPVSLGKAFIISLGYYAGAFVLALLFIVLQWIVASI